VPENLSVIGQPRPFHKFRNAKRDKPIRLLPGTYESTAVGVSYFRPLIQRVAGTP